MFYWVLNTRLRWKYLRNYREVTVIIQVQSMCLLHFWTGKRFLHMILRWILTKLENRQLQVWVASFLYIAAFLLMATHYNTHLTIALRFHLISRCGNTVKTYTFTLFVPKLWNVRAIRQKLWRNYTFPQNFHTRKLGEISVCFVV